MKNWYLSFLLIITSVVFSGAVTAQSSKSLGNKGCIVERNNKVIFKDNGHVRLELPGVHKAIKRLKNGQEFVKIDATIVSDMKHYALHTHKEYIDTPVVRDMKQTITLLDERGIAIWKNTITLYPDKRISDGEDTNSDCGEKWVGDNGYVVVSGYHTTDTSYEIPFVQVYNRKGQMIFNSTPLEGMLEFTNNFNIMTIVGHRYYRFIELKNGKEKRVGSLGNLRVDEMDNGTLNLNGLFYNSISEFPDSI
jgi:hypothetical protein